MNPDYQPQTVNADGWLAAQKAWSTLFASITVIQQCLLHANIQQQVWDI